MFNAPLPLLIGALILASNLPLRAINLRIYEGLPLADNLYVNGHGPYRFLVDTGTNVNLIDAGLAQSIGLQATFEVGLASSIGSRPVMGTDDAEIALDSVRADRQKILFCRLEAIRHTIPEVQGVLGQSFLSRFDYLLDLRAKRLEFGQRDPKGVRVPLGWINGRPVVATNLGQMVPDSGSGQVVLFGVTPTGGSGRLRTVTGSKETGMAPNQSLWIGGRVFWRGDAVAVAHPAQSEAGVDGLLPVSLFKSVYVCNSGRFVVFD